MSIQATSRRLLALLLAMGSAGVSFAAEATAGREAQLAAAYVFNFMKFVEWPTSAPTDVLQVCFFGAEGVRDALASATADKRVGALRVEVRAVGAAGIERCHVIYFERNLEREARLLAGASALTIGEGEQFTSQGGVIQLYTENNRLRFVVNVDNAKRAGLQVSSNLLQLATRVERGAGR